MKRRLVLAMTLLVTAMTLCAAPYSDILSGAKANSITLKNAEISYRNALISVDKNSLEDQDYSELGKLIYRNDAEHKAVAVGKSETYMIYDRDDSETVRMYYLAVTLEECVTVNGELLSLARLDPITTPEEDLKALLK